MKVGAIDDLSGLQKLTGRVCKCRWRDSHVFTEDQIVFRLDL